MSSSSVAYRLGQKIGGSRRSTTLAAAVSRPNRPPFPPLGLQPVAKLPTIAALSDSSSTPEVASVNAGKTRMHPYIVRPPEFPSSLPRGYGVSNHPIPAMEADPTWDPAIHLQVEPPKTILSSDFVEHSFPLKESSDFSLGYTKPFRLLSDEGVNALEAVIKANECFARSTERIPKCLRGLGYRSSFVRNFNQDDKIIDLLSQFAGKPLAPHGMHMNMSHVNFGRPVKRGETPAIVDQWHVDSVDFVLIIIASDVSDSVGGDFEVLHKKGVRDNQEFMTNGIDDNMAHLVETIKCPAKGHAIFMQGSQVLHRVTPVLEALGPRISVVNSYMSRNVFDADYTRLHTFKTDPEHIYNVEFARHQAWKVEGMMRCIEEMQFGTPKEELAQVMRGASKILEKTARLLNEEEDDVLAWVKEEAAEDEFTRANS